MLIFQNTRQIQLIKLKNKNNQNPVIVFFMIFLFSIPFFPPLFHQDQVENFDFPYQIHATIGKTDSITLIWRSKNLIPSLIRYDYISRKRIPLAYKYGKQAKLDYIFNIFAKSFGFLYSATINLLPNHTYYFIIGSINVWSQEYHFDTPSENPDTISFIIGSDYQEGDFQVRNKIEKLMKYHNPSFVLFAGDIVGNGNLQILWDFWFLKMQSWEIGNRIIPLISCPGNHEEDSKLYYQQMQLPKWYSLNYSNYLHIISLHSEYVNNSVQLQFLKQDLKRHENFTWKIVIFHHPPYSNRNCSLKYLIKTNWIPLFDEYNVDLVFSGHNHFYERSFPLKNHTINPNGTRYIVSGSWGAKLRNFPPGWWTEVKNSEYSYCSVKINSNIISSNLTLQQIRLDNSIGDSITIIKNLK